MDFQKVGNVLIPDSTIEEIQTRTSIVDVIGERVELKKAGTNFLGICPFHKEKTPSFNVNPVRGMYKCFGCQASGNIFTFLRQYEGLSFPEAVKKLGEKVGVSVEQVKDYKPAPKQALSKRSEELKALDWAARYFNFLLQKKPEFKFAKDYVIKRGLSDRTIDKFLIGVSPEGWSTLYDLLKKRGFKDQTLVNAGLTLESQKHKGSYYDRFRERLMFPIRDPDGNVVGFGGRILKEDPEKQTAKYINSSESDIFTKRELLYGMYENQRGLRTRSEALIVEGYMDVAALSEKGVENAVATMGTAMTDQHCALIRKYSRRVVTIFDSDKAGKDAWHRSVELLLKHGVLAKDLSLPPGMDPDEFVQDVGADAFYEKCEKAPRQVTKLLKEIASKGPLSEEEKTRYLEQLTPILVITRKRAERFTLWDALSRVFNLSIDSIKELANRPTPSASMEAQTPAPSPPPARLRNEAPARLQLSRLERFFLEAALNEPALFRQFDPAQWGTILGNSILSKYLKELREAPFDKEAALVKWLRVEQNEALQKYFADLLATDKTEGPAFAEMQKLIVSRCKELEIKSLMTQIHLAQQLGDEPEQLRLLNEIRQIRQPVEKENQSTT